LEPRKAVLRHRKVSLKRQAGVETVPKKPVKRGKIFPEAATLGLRGDREPDVAKLADLIGVVSGVNYIGGFS